ncbi:ligand-binding sensor domain-containing protein [Rasiella sp. SM2506]|uniref:ligand-binding sensor domain-containing protein n=1 Tax=Rasiella sp. SM2506 TaxID=3423914 RepID=UPI003D7A3D27
MNTLYKSLKICFIIFATSFLISCGSKSDSKIKNDIIPHTLTKDLQDQIGEYVVETFEDSKKTLWFGTLEKGVAKYDGKTLTYVTTTDGLPSNRIVSIIEDTKGNLWFGTGAGLSRYDRKTFTNFNTTHGLLDTRISTILLDSKGNFWIGTWGGVYKFDGIKFTYVTIPIPPIQTQPNEDTKNWVTTLLEDSKGNIWIGRDGYGACKYDGKSFVHYLKDDGLYSNNVQKIVEGTNGDIWFGTRVAEKDNPDSNKRFGDGGITKYNGINFTHYPEVEGLNENDVYEMYKDNLGNIWIGTLSNGVYKYNGTTFINYKVPKPIMSIMKDSKGILWMGCAGGLFSINSTGIVNVTTKGPWE